MIKSFKHKGVERLFSTRSKVGIQAAHAPNRGRLLTALNRAKSPDDMNQPGWGLHELEDHCCRVPWLLTEDRQRLEM